MTEPLTVDELIASGNEYLQAGDKSSARPLLRRATELDVNNERAWDLRAQAAEDDEEARKCLELVIALNPNNSDARTRLVWLEAEALRRQVASATSEHLPWFRRINWLPIVVVLLLLSLIGIGILYGYPAVTAYLAAQNVKPTVAALSVATMPATWTWTPTFTPTLTRTSTPTSTPTNTPTVTPVPTSTNTPTVTPTPVPPPRPFIVPRPTATPLPQYRPVMVGCYHAGDTFVEGIVTDRAGLQQPGVRLVVSDSPLGNIRAQAVTGTFAGRSYGYYVLMINRGHPEPGEWYVWVIGSDGMIASDPQAAHFSANKLKEDNLASCWRAEINFVAQ